MNFLNPIILYGLVAASLPVLFHFLSRRRSRDIHYPTLAFLESMKSDTMRRLRFKQLLVMLLRTLIIVCIVLAFARPTLQGTFDETARSASVFVVDGSPSMHRVYNGERLFSAAVATVEELVASLGEDDRAAVIVAGNEPRILEPGLSRDKERLLDSLDDLEFRWQEPNPGDALAMASALLEESVLANTELFYLTDAQEAAFPDSLPATGAALRWYVVRYGPDIIESPVVESCELLDPVLVPGREISFAVKSRIPGTNRSVDSELFVNGERIDRTEAGRTSASVETKLAFTPTATGWYSIRASARAGGRETGRAGRLAIRVEEPLRLLVVAATRQDGYFVSRALNPDPEQQLFDMETVTPEALTAETIATADVIILAHVPSLPGTAYRALLDAVSEKGAGLLVFPAGTRSASLYENGIFRDMAPLEIEGTTTYENESTYMLIEQFDVAHGIFGRMMVGDNVTRPKVWSALRFRPGDDVGSIARLSNGFPAFVESVCGNGRVLVSAVSLHPEDTDLPLTGIYVPFMLNSMRYLSGRQPVGARFEVGDVIDLHLGVLSPETAVSIKPGDGAARTVLTGRDTRGTYISGETAGQPGFYSVMAGDREIHRYSVDIPAGEILSGRVDSGRLERLFGSRPHRFIDSTEDVIRVVGQARFGRELYGMFLMVAGLLFAAEMLLSKRV